MSANPTPPTPTPIADGVERVVRTLDASRKLVSTALGRVDRLVADVLRDSTRVARDTEALYTASAQQVATISAAVRATPRFTRILGEAVRILAGYRLHRAVVARLPAEELRGQRDELDRASAARLSQLCIELRGGVLKLGQFLSCRMDLLPEAYVEALSRLQDQVPAVPTADIVARVEAELGRPIGELFAEFDPEPIAAASLAQVHGATLADGTRVAVKVQVPGVDDLVEVDIAALRAVASLIGDAFGFDLATTARELASSLRAELDYESEARNVADFGACFAGDERVVVPRVYAELSSARVLTMERLDGARLTEYLDACEGRGDEGAVDRDRLFGTLLDCVCAQVLRHGLLHADPHPGNFLVCEGGRLAILDFGSVQRFDPEVRAAYARVAIAILMRDHAQVAELLGVMGFRSRTGDPAALLEISEMMLQIFREGAADLSAIDPREQLERAMRVAREHPVVEIPQDFVMLGRVFGALGGLLMRYRPQLALHTILGPHLAAAAR